MSLNFVARAQKGGLEYNNLINQVEGPATFGVKGASIGATDFHSFNVDMPRTHMQSVVNGDDNNIVTVRVRGNDPAADRWRDAHHHHVGDYREGRNPGALIVDQIGSPHCRASPSSDEWPIRSNWCPRGRSAALVGMADRDGNANRIVAAVRRQSHSHGPKHVEAGARVSARMAYVCLGVCRLGTRVLRLMTQRRAAADAVAQHRSSAAGSCSKPLQI